MLGYRPLVYFWIAEYTDGSALPQFDPTTGKENRFSQVDQHRLVRFGYYPFSVELAQKILETEKLVVNPTVNQPIVVTLEPNDELVAYRTNTVCLHSGNGVVDHEKTVYVLGVKGKQVLHLNENGDIFDD
ncbi:MAG: hypothetical protein WC325_05925 [Candidatus Bathyarchaeia archaeon]